MQAYKITYENGESYVTSIAEGVPAKEVESYFVGQSFVQSDEKTMLKVVKAEKL